MTCTHESGTAPQKLGDWKGGSDEGQMITCGSGGDLGVRMYVVYILVGTVIEPARQKRVRQIVGI